MRLAVERLGLGGVQYLVFCTEHGIEVGRVVWEAKGTSRMGQLDLRARRPLVNYLLRSEMTETSGESAGRFLPGEVGM